MSDTAGGRPGSDAGNALVEFTYLAVLLMVPLVYLLLSVFAVQSAAFGVTEAARQAGRAFVTADSAAEGTARATAAAQLALQDQGVQAPVAPTITCTASAGGRCEQVRVEVSHLVRLPVLGDLLPEDRGGYRVTGVHVTGFDRFRERAS